MIKSGNPIPIGDTIEIEELTWRVSDVSSDEKEYFDDTLLLSPI